MSKRASQPADNHSIATATAEPAAGPVRGQLLAVEEDGWLLVSVAGAPWRCLCLEGKPLEVGDSLLVLPAGTAGPAVVLGRVGPYRTPQPQARLVLEATEALTLKCGDVAIDLRATDGKLMLRGEDVLLRARGTQRIRAGAVAIN
ncbi:hypothetical protein GRF61_23840 [Azoarcus sp. TTM-91]|uniref:hypothetical protein n=1 Tax=Azoarcus sp. TTM-91 TaxID=2691581 RepID=UPI00145DC76B|nr:hypothetical protein [Azoarcus sp. TTM-91]NMG37494.1 hypothetical protein [Azoarcus sp. TTM-91]